MQMQKHNIVQMKMTFFFIFTEALLFCNPFSISNFLICKTEIFTNPSDD